MLVQMLFGDKFIIMVERLDVHLFIWKQKGRCVDLLEKSRSVVNVTIFMSAVKYTGCPRRNVRDFGRVFLMLNYTDITQNTYIQS